MIKSKTRFVTRIIQNKSLAFSLKLGERGKENTVDDELRFGGTTEFFLKKHGGGCFFKHMSSSLTFLTLKYVFS